MRGRRRAIAAAAAAAAVAAKAKHTASKKAWAGLLSKPDAADSRPPQSIPYSGPGVTEVSARVDGNNDAGSASSQGRKIFERFRAVMFESSTPAVR